MQYNNILSFVNQTNEKIKLVECPQNKYDKQSQAYS